MSGVVGVVVLLGSLPAEIYVISRNSVIMKKIPPFAPQKRSNGLGVGIGLLTP
jgi:hypothetical protein